ncbi:energy transducer TonB [uncultured Algoriphagus sp.]|uniref:energy transducer TonB n=1 Tax=uncultured Algoriphagus sp. TaxID=417365 RepID=UPI0030EC5C33|tara:strand:+ start:17887 stop:18525 length:639 start_codon:yes stop_codon:yes gene_type:complete
MLRTLFISFFFLVSSFSFAQTTFNPGTESDFVKATYSNGDLITILGQNLTYPKEAAINGTEGDVVYLITIDHTGKLVSYEAKERISEKLSKQAEESIKSLTSNWSPTKVHGEPIDREYLLIFSYRIYYNASPVDYHSVAKKFEEKGKIEKSVRTYDDAIKKYPYEPVYYTMRAKYKKELDDLSGAEADKLKAEKLNMEVLAVVEIAQSQSIR